MIKIGLRFISWNSGNLDAGRNKLPPGQAVKNTLPSISAVEYQSPDCANILLNTKRPAVDLMEEWTDVRVCARSSRTVQYVCMHCIYV